MIRPCSAILSLTFPLVTNNLALAKQQKRNPSSQHISWAVISGCKIAKNTSRAQKIITENLISKVKFDQLERQLNY